MKKILFAFKEFIHSFLLFMGILFFLLCLRKFLGSISDNDLGFYGMRDCCIFAAVFALFHAFIFTDSIVERMSIKLRCLIGFLPCSYAAGILVWQFTYPSLLGWRSDGHSQFLQVFDQYFSTIVGAVVILLVFILIEMQFKKIGKRYDKALQEYKQRNKDKENS